jgi:hypothetical protein
MNPTCDMIEFFNKRTNNHICAVNYFAGLLNIAQPKNHDKSKFAEPEFIPYVLFTWYKNKLLRPLPADFLPAWKSAVAHHYANNAHHPEFYKHAEEMPKECIGEMLCDWSAMSYELNTSVFDYFQKTALPKHNFTLPQQNIIADGLAFLEKNKNMKTLNKLWIK